MKWGAVESVAQALLPAALTLLAAQASEARPSRLQSRLQAELPALRSTK